MLLRSVLLVSVLSVPLLAFGQSCPTGQVYNSCDGPQFGPGPCTPGCYAIPGVNPPTSPEPTGPNELCITEPCQVVQYRWSGDLVVAESQLPNGYAVMGWSGPCFNEDRSQCPDILNQAFNDLRTNALRANRAQSFVLPE